MEKIKNSNDSYVSLKRKLGFLKEDNKEVFFNTKENKLETFEEQLNKSDKYFPFLLDFRLKQQKLN